MTVLNLWVKVKEDDTFEVKSFFSECWEHGRSSILVVDYKSTPWPRKDGNLLW